MSTALSTGSGCSDCLRGHDDVVEPKLPELLSNSQWQAAGQAVGGGAVELYGAGPDRLVGEEPMRFQLLVRCSFEAQTAPAKTTSCPARTNKLPSKNTNCPAKLDTAFGSRALETSETSETTVSCQKRGISVVMLYRALPCQVTPIVEASRLQSADVFGHATFCIRLPTSDS